MTQKVKLLVAPCSYEAAKYAVTHWHYSGSMPTPPVTKFGVWEDERFIGVVLFSRGSNNNMLKPYNVQINEGCELSRIALDNHHSEVSKIGSICLRELRKNYKLLRVVVSYADPDQHHVGNIYQAMNWVYAGQSSPDCYYIDKKGRRWHSRQVSRTGVKRQYGELRNVPKHSDCKKVLLSGKFRYLYPLDRKMRQQIEPLRKPYPKRADD